jgi:hypothetical protein
MVEATARPSGRSRSCVSARSILIASIDSCARCDSEKKPAPKSSIAGRTRRHSAALVQRNATATQALREERALLSQAVTAFRLA